MAASAFSYQKLGELCLKIGSGATPRGGSNVYLKQGDVAFIRSQNIQNVQFTKLGLVYLQQTHADQLVNVSVEQGDVLLNITGDSVARCCQVDPTVLPARVNQHVAIIRPNGQKLNSQFLKYYLVSSHMQKFMLGLAGAGATRSALTKSMIESFKVPVPSIQEQRRIAQILGSLDDKIELNRQMNETLEAMGQALFKSWFVDFDPVIDKALAAGKEIPEPLQDKATFRQTLGDKRKPLPADIAALFPDEFEESELGWIPKGWEVSKIGFKLYTILGGTPSRAKAEFWHGGDIAWINSGKTNEFRIVEPSEFITQEALEKSATKILPRRTTVLAITGATLGQVSLTEIECCANQSVVGVVGTDQIPSEFIYFWIRENINKLILSQTGGAQQHINKGNVNDLDLLCPRFSIMSFFRKNSKPLFDKIAENCFQAKDLRSLRDTLLSKLILGEIRVLDAERMVEEVLSV